MSKNIEEYVAHKVIEHMRYRDEEIRILRLELENFDVILCDFCKKYRKYDLECEFCDLVSCTDCLKVVNYGSWNLSGCDACFECETEYCTMCRNLKSQCNKSGMCA